MIRFRLKKHGGFKTSDEAVNKRMNNQKSFFNAVHKLNMFCVFFVDFEADYYKDGPIKNGCFHKWINNSTIERYG